MFGLGGGELLVVMVLAIILIGPKDIPRVASQLGKWYREWKLAVTEVKSTVEKEIDWQQDSPPPPSLKNHE